MSNLTFKYTMRRFSERHGITGASMDVSDPDLIIKILAAEHAGYEIEVINLIGEGLSIVTIFNTADRKSMLLDGSNPDVSTEDAIAQLIDEITSGAIAADKQTSGEAA